MLAKPVDFATAAPGLTLVVPVAGEPVAEFDHQSTIDALEKAAKPYRITATRLVTQYDSYYLDRNHSLLLPCNFRAV